MASITDTARISLDIQCLTIEPTRYVPDLKEDVCAGLLNRPRSLPPKYFYDARGSELFNRICDTPEYYPTRTEDALLQQAGSAIISQTRPDYIIELGSGNSNKTKKLFNACEQQTHVCAYAPFDICRPVLEAAAGELKENYRWLEVEPLLGDYHAGLGNLPRYDGVKLYLFLGSNIGNFIPKDARAFISEIKDQMKPGDYLLLGADRIKPPSVLNAAYNDSQGVTALFNLNVLRVLNRELEADFHIDNFTHEAIYNERLNRIEMYLASKTPQEVAIDKINEKIRLEMGEKILTELSYKFHPDELEAMFSDLGFNIIQHFEPDNRYFSLVLARLK